MGSNYAKQSLMIRKTNRFAHWPVRKPHRLPKKCAEDREDRLGGEAFGTGMLREDVGEFGVKLMRMNER